MARSVSILLSDHFDSFIQQLVESGRYDSRSAAVRAGLRLLEREEKHLDWMRQRIAEGVADLEAGWTYEDSDEFWEVLDHEVDERLKRGDEPGSHILP